MIERRSRGAPRHRTGEETPRPTAPAKWSVPNQTFQILFTPPQRRSFKPTPIWTSLNLSIFLASNIRTKKAVVRLRYRKGPERDEKRPDMGPWAAARGPDKSPRRPAFRAVPAGAQTGEKNVSTEETGGAKGTVVKPSPAPFQ